MLTATEEALLQEYIKAAKRAEIPLEDFAWPDAPDGPKYPCDTQDHIDSCATLLGHAPEDKQAEIKARAIRIAKRHGFSIPDSWKDDDKAEESFRPAPKIATVPVCWLKYNARSANGRIYPRTTCDRIFQAGLHQLANEQSAAITCFVSHETANNNVNTALVGGVPKIWQEGDEFWANIDIADTSVSRDMLGLMENKALRAVSMRVLGVELKQDPSFDMPLVVIPEGIEPTLMGIDLTTRPGLVDVARIGQLLYESQQPPAIHTESFALDADIAISREATPMTIPLYLQILTEAASLTPDREAHQKVHDHLAGVLDETVKAVHAQESARFRAGVALSEEGRALAMKYATRLAAAHDESAKQCGMTCEGAYNEALNIAPSDTDQDGDNPAAGNDPDNDGESAARRNDTMNEHEALALLKSKGYNVAPPKTAEEQLQELRTRLEEQSREIAALKATPPPQRQTQAQSLLNEQSYQPEQLYEDGDYLVGPLHPGHWKALANRRVPWPKDVDPKAALHEMAPYLAYRLISEEAAMRGRDIGSIIRPDERI